MVNLLRHVQKSFERRGFHIGRVPAYTTLRHHLQRILSRLEINCVLDVGAHKGEYRQLLRDIGYAGRIVSFEPVALTFEMLSRNSALDSQWKGMKCALSSVDSTAEMNLFERSDFNSLLSPAGDHSVSFGTGVRVCSSERVQLKRLDGVISECIAGITEPRIFLKMDTQGHDLEVLKGASTCLPAIQAIQSEMAAKLLYAKMPHMGDALLQFHSLGFSPSAFHPVNIDVDGFTVIEWDCVMVQSGARSLNLGQQRHALLDLGKNPRNGV